MSEMNGKTVLVTGANRGIGRALAARFVAAGATCILTARSAEAAATLQRELATRDGRVAVDRCDIANADQVTALRDRVKGRYPQIDVLVNNAGYYAEADRSMHAGALDADVLRATLDVNLFGTVAMCRAFAPLVPRGGRIINVSSTMGQLSDGLGASSAAYSISKTALNAYTSALASDLESRGIMVDSVHPGWVQTDMGGAGARLAPEAAAEAMYFLAVRPAGETGKFWYDKHVIAW